MAGPVASAVFALGNVLKDVIHNGRVYTSEPDVLSALSVVDDFISAFVKHSEMPALATGDERAAVEDVSLRPTPPGMPSIPVNTPTIDYDKLAAALVRAQQEANARNEVVPSE
jgi:hypothetical protein